MQKNYSECSLLYEFLSVLSYLLKIDATGLYSPSMA